MRRQRSFILLVLLALFSAMIITGCGKKTVVDNSGTSGADPGAMGPAESLETDAAKGDDIMEGRTSGPMLPIYFDFDLSTLRADQVERIETNADFMKNKQDVQVRIEGNCDPRGTKDYNLALGERRAQSAKQYLINLGVEASRLSTVSWGAEKLLLFGHDELSWSQNRRDDFVVIK